MKEKLLISACLLGMNCKYSGGNNYCPAAAALGERYELIPVCPEVLGGLPTPRAPSERAGERVTARDGTDVTAAFDPNFAEVYEKNNSARVNYGVGLCKYTGSRGKGGASDAGAEVVAYVRRLLDDKGILWQMAELGKADQGGGGTVACYMANRNIDTLDAGVPVLSMHSPFETVSKLDCYMTYAACKAVYEG